MTKKPLTIVQEGCGRNRTSRDAVDDVYTKKYIIGVVVEAAG